MSVPVQCPASWPTPRVERGTEAGVGALSALTADGRRKMPCRLRQAGPGLGTPIFKCRRH